jgi:cytosine/adenosine deaminase-related metal-dependent hydrolase
MLHSSDSVQNSDSGHLQIDLAGFLLLPGLINAHDHLEFALFPRLAGRVYRNYVEWGEDIHTKFPEVIAAHRAVPKEVRVWWGAIRNLLCGVTTVCHHNPVHPEMLRDDFPVRVVRSYGWAHSPALGGDLRRARADTPEGAPFIVHACEGTDDMAREEVWELEKMGLLDDQAVLVHGLALDGAGAEQLIERGSSLIVCPSSNQFLFEALPDLYVLSSIGNLTLGNDSPLTAAGDLLDEIRFARRFCGVPPRIVWPMVTNAAAKILRLRNGEGDLREGGFADFIAVKDSGQAPAERLLTLTLHDVELVVIGGRVQLSSESMLGRIPPSMRRGLQPLYVDGQVRWLRAPISDLLRGAEAVSVADQLRLGVRTISISACPEVCRAL